MPIRSECLHIYSYVSFNIAFCIFLIKHAEIVVNKSRMFGGVYIYAFEERAM